MIKQIRLHNFQCHKDLTVDCAAGITLLQGNSNAGKTAVLRALYWVAFNTPQGDAIISTWALNDGKFKKGEYTEVEIQADDHVIVRRRDKDFNGYIVDGVVFEALRGAVPAEVTQILNLTTANVQRQLDPPFLLSMTPGEAANYLNELVHLEAITEVVGIAQRKYQDTKKRAATARDELATTNVQIEALNWISEVRDITTKAQENDELISALMRKISAGEESIHAYENLDHVDGTVLDSVGIYMDRLNDVSLKIAEILPAAKTNLDGDAKVLEELKKIAEVLPGAESELENLENLRGESKSLKAKISAENSCNGYAEFEKVITRVSGALEGFNSLEVPSGNADALKSTISSAIVSIQEYEASVEGQAVADEIAVIEKQLATMACPVCGKPYGEDGKCC